MKQEVSEQTECLCPITIPAFLLPSASFGISHPEGPSGVNPSALGAGHLPGAVSTPSEHRSPRSAVSVEFWMPGDPAPGLRMSLP